MDNQLAKTTGGFVQNMKLENILEIVSPNKTAAQTIDNDKEENKTEIITLP